ncbi:MAG: ParB/RepB/Spo0J family partition protein [Acidimicrobiales bacterium]
MVRQTGLGRGLGALIPGDEDRPSGLSGVAYRELPVGAISANPYQPREQFDELSLSALTASVREVGVLQPILVRAKGQDEFELIAGERRWRAAKRAGLRTIPAIVREIEDLTSLEHALVENLHREDLGPLEEAAAYQQLMEDFGLTQEAVSQRVGKSRSAVANSLRLLQLPASVQGMLVDGQLTAGHARALLGLASRQEQDRLARLAVADELTVREVERLVREGSTITPPAKKSGSRERPAALLEVEQRMADRLDTRVQVTMGDKRGKMVIEFADMDDLGRIFSLLEHDTND